MDDSALATRDLFFVVGSIFLSIGATSTGYLLSTRQLTREASRLGDVLRALLLSMEAQGHITLHRNQAGGITNGGGHLIGYSIPEGPDQPSTTALTVVYSSRWLTLRKAAPTIIATLFMAIGAVMIAVAIVG